jgi:hypothetical protein
MHLYYIVMFSSVFCFFLNFGFGKKESHYLIYLGGRRIFSMFDSCLIALCIGASECIWCFDNLFISCT